jgi:DNA-binding CsgD family transcriptional regulator
LSGLPWEFVPEHIRAPAELTCSDRELEILKLTAAGHGTTEAARIMGVKQGTASVFLRRAQAKLRACLYPASSREREVTA